MAETVPFWLPGVHGARRPYLVARGRIASAFRAWFAGEGFLEVETAALQVSPGNETHLHAFATDLIGPGGERRTPVSSHLAGIRLQEAAGGGRDGGFSISPACSVTASAAPCTIPSSPCWNGTVRMNPMRG